MIETVANSLEGEVLDNGWKVKSRINPEEDATGGKFSIPYIVERDREEAFMKALDFKAFFDFKREGGIEVSIVDALKEFVDTFKFERDLTRKCRNKNLGNVIRLLDEGEFEVEDVAYGTVPYLIFEMAEGDVRSKLNYTSDIETVWKLKSLHGIAKGLNQLHGIEVSHQDLKPSNVLICENELSKIGDLGRSIAQEFSAPHDGAPFTGDYTYAPPEILYGYTIPDWHKRAFAIDMYLLGGLICYYFTGLTMNALIRSNLQRGTFWGSWTGTFEQVRPYVFEAYEASLYEFSQHIEGEDLSTELTKILSQLCHPFPEKRGHPHNVSSQLSNYSLIRYITIFDRLHKSVQYKIFH